MRLLFLALATLLVLSAAHAERTQSDPITNSLGMEFVWIPAGTFTMGSAPDAPGHEPDENLRSVTISEPFYLMTTPVTRGQWLELVDGVPSAFPECGNQCPVDGLNPAWVDWYVQALSEQDQHWDYRLPTEAEWEYAARAGTGSVYYTGGCLTARQANVSGKIVPEGCQPFGSSPGPKPVGQYPPNPWGLYDMLGSTWELCADWYGPYGEGEATDPSGPPEGDYRVLRGGSWHFYAIHARAANRFQARNNIAGFRLVAIPEKAAVQGD